MNKFLSNVTSPPPFFHVVVHVYHCYVQSVYTLIRHAAYYTNIDLFITASRKQLLATFQKTNCIRNEVIIFWIDCDLMKCGIFFFPFENKGKSLFHTKYRIYCTPMRIFSLNIYFVIKYLQLEQFS